MGISHSFARPLPSSVNALTDEELLVMIDAARKDSSTPLGITDKHTSWTGPTAWRITPDAVVKRGPAHEAYIMTYVASHSSLRVPNVCRLIPVLPEKPFVCQNSGSLWTMWMAMCSRLPATDELVETAVDCMEAT
ncbi:hypothetical protein CPB85DRAFT_267232 [Mucidula mucida]|nr:hypothetical protein CPB85DRAFT_267232 [Mucidula mucida]